ncbi:MAG: ComEA family DNA-binding protein [Bacteroidales bacterium]
MGHKGFLRKYFSFTRREQRGILVLLAFILLIWILTFIFQQQAQNTSLEYLPDSLLMWVQTKEQTKKTQSPKAFENPAVTQEQVLLFEFDPNLLDEEGWKKLGLPAHTIRSILNYRKAGGRFYKPEDLSRIYTLSQEDFARLKSYIRIENVKSAAGDSLSSSRKIISKVPSRQIPTVELNSADTNLLAELPGIGPAFARRIWKYGKRLGGYYQTEQLLEVYGMDASRLDKIRPFIVIDTLRIIKMDLNQASFKELLRHPYLEYYMVKAIADYRQKHHGIRDVSELKSLPLMYDELYNKLRPYLNTNPEYLPHP